MGLAFKGLILDTCLCKRASNYYFTLLKKEKKALPPLKKKQKEKEKRPLCLENLEIPGICFTPDEAPGNLNFGENTSGNTWKNIFLLKKKLTVNHESDFFQQCALLA